MGGSEGGSEPMGGAAGDGSGGSTEPGSGGGAGVEDLELSLSRITLRADRGALGVQGTVTSQLEGALALEVNLLLEDGSVFEPGAGTGELFLPLSSDGDFTLSGTLAYLVPDEVLTGRVRVRSGEASSEWVELPFSESLVGASGDACDVAAVLTQCDSPLVCSGLLGETRQCTLVERACPAAVAQMSLLEQTDDWGLVSDFSDESVHAETSSCGGSAPQMVSFVAPELGTFRVSLSVEADDRLAVLGARSHCASSAPLHEQSCEQGRVDAPAVLDLYLEQDEEVFLVVDSVGIDSTSRGFELSVVKL